MKPEQYPKLVRIGDVDYRVCFAKKLKNGDLGYCDDDMKLIAISRDQEPEEMLATFIHETLHAFEFETGMELGHPRIRKLEWMIAHLFKQLKSTGD
jgi:hypothetical protein